MSSRVQKLSCVLIGFSLSFFFISFFFGFLVLIPRFWVASWSNSLFTGLAGLIPMSLVIGLIIKERKKHIFSIPIIGLSTFVGILFFLLPLVGMVFLFPSAIIGDSLRTIFAGIGFFSIGLFGIYLEKKTKTLGLFLIILAAVLLLSIPLAITYPEDLRNLGTFDQAVKDRYPIPLTCISLNLLVLGASSLLYTKYGKNKIAANVQSGELGSTKTELKVEDSLYKNKPNTGWRSLGFLLFVLGPLGFAIASMVFEPNLTIVNIGSLTEITLTIVLLSASLSIFGAALILYEKSKLGLSIVTAGWMILLVAAFTYIYRTAVTMTGTQNMTYITYMNPFAGYALPLVLISVAVYVIGFSLMLKTRLQPPTS
jgi:hypothetical protein